MTDNEIVKACKDCLHYEACKGTYSSAKGDEDILYDFDGEMYANSGCEDFQDKDLINRQKAKIEALKMDNKQLENDNFNANMNCEHLQAENERLKGVLPEKSGVFTVIENAVVYTKSIDEYNLFLKKVFTKAYKEFAERLKHKAINIGVNDSIVSTFAIDEILKELVGDNNAE